jgi:DNA repair protein RadC
MDGPAAFDDPRPRERLGRCGAGALGDDELVALVLGAGRPGADARTLGRRLLETLGGRPGLARRTAADFSRVPGVGPALGARVAAAVELGRRTLVPDGPVRPRLTTPERVAGFLLPSHGAAPVERIGLVALDTCHHPVAVRVVSVGSLDATLFHPREVFREAALASAAAIVLFHDHPSGDPTPSQEDLALTARMVRAGEVMGIEVVDHVILADHRYCSLREAGHLGPCGPAGASRASDKMVGP